MVLAHTSHLTMRLSSTHMSLRQVWRCMKIWNKQPAVPVKCLTHEHCLTISSKIGIAGPRLMASRAEFAAVVGVKEWKRKITGMWNQVSWRKPTPPPGLSSLKMHFSTGQLRGERPLWTNGVFSPSLPHVSRFQSILHRLQDQGR